MTEGVYVLCAATSFLCMVMLLRGYSQTKVRLLFWSAICFFGLALDNVLLYADLVIMPDLDLALYRRATALVALMSLIIGLIWDAN